MEKIHRLTCFLTALAYSYELKTPKGYLPSFYFPQTEKYFHELAQFVSKHALDDTWINGVSGTYLQNQDLEFGSARLELYDAFDSVEYKNGAYLKLTIDGREVGESTYVLHKTCFDRIGDLLWKELKEPVGYEKFGIVFVKQ